MLTIHENRVHFRVIVTALLDLLSIERAHPSVIIFSKIRAFSTRRVDAVQDKDITIAVTVTDAERSRLQAQLRRFGAIYTYDRHAFNATASRLDNAF